MAKLKQVEPPEKIEFSPQAFKFLVKFENAQIGKILTS